VALLISITDQRLQFVCASGEETNVSMKEIASTILPLINGKGGGNARLAQGGGEFTASITPEMFLKRMEEAIISR
jgi:alanyl-tRNA synthetase